jgi:hypothetical protein
MDEVTFIPSVIPESRVPEYAGWMVDKMLASHTAIEAMVLVKNMQRVVDEMTRILLEPACANVAGMKDVPVLGATVSYRKLPSQWVYDQSDQDLQALEEALAVARENLKNHQLYLQQAAMSGIKEIVDPETGTVIGAPTEIQRGHTVAVSFR